MTRKFNLFKTQNAVAENRHMNREASTSARKMSWCIAVVSALSGVASALFVWSAASGPSGVSAATARWAFLMGLCFAAWVSGPFFVLAALSVFSASRGILQKLLGVGVAVNIVAVIFIALTYASDAQGGILFLTVPFLQWIIVGGVFSARLFVK